MIPLDGDFILAVAPKYSGASGKRQKEIVDAIAPVFEATLNDYDIDTMLRVAHFMGQVTHECAGFSTTEEFADGSKYEGRVDLGNVNPGDGKRYKGRGLLQLTGRANYRKYGAILGIDLEGNPLHAGDPIVSLKIACEYWKSRKINAACDADDLVWVTKLVNGGKNGLKERQQFLQKAKALLSGSVAGGGSSEPVLRRGSDGDAVGDLQRLLRTKGFPVAIDEDFGAATELAIKTLQSNAGLVADGVVGAATWAALKS